MKKVLTIQYNTDTEENRQWAEENISDAFGLLSKILPNSENGIIEEDYGNIQLTQFIATDTPQKIVNDAVVYAFPVKNAINLWEDRNKHLDCIIS